MYLSLKKGLERSEQRERLLYGQAANLLAKCLFDRLYICSSGTEKSEIANDGLAVAEDAISVLSSVADKEDLVLAFSQASVQAWYVANITENEEERKIIADKSVNYAARAIKLSEEVENLYYKATARWGGVWSNLFFTEDIEVALKYAKEMLGHASAIRDNFFRGLASYMIADVTDMKVINEANPDERPLLCDEIIRYSEDGIRFLNLVFQDSLIAETYLLPAQAYSVLASDFAVNLSEKLFYSKRAVDIGKKGLEHAVRSGSPEAMISTLHGLSKAYYYYANLEPRQDYKPELFAEALGYRKELIRISKDSFPSNLWVLGVGIIYAAEIEAELSRLEKDEKRKVDVLTEAIGDMEQGVSYSKSWNVSRSVPSFVASIAGYEDTLGDILDEGYVLTADPTNLVRANEAFVGAAENFKKVDLPSRVAESYWKIAKNLDRVSNYDQAAKNFENAFATYKAASQRIVQFSSFYLDYA